MRISPAIKMLFLAFFYVFMLCGGAAAWEEITIKGVVKTIDLSANAFIVSTYGG